MNKLRAKNINYLFLTVFIFFAIYYAWRLFNIAPWYDELYTYYHFIDEGPIYAATHWPLPNNHVFFSVLSGVLNRFTNNFIGLRGISYIAALFSLWGIYKLLSKCVDSMIAVAGVLLYASMYLVNNLAVQGRGYSLANACLISALLALYEICIEDSQKRYYVLFSLSLIAGLYTLVSSVYWVIPICVAGGLLLMLHKKWKRLLTLIFTSLCAVAGTLALYGILWASKGIELIRNDVNSGYFQEMPLGILKTFPLYTIKRGMLFMLSDRNVQSIDRNVFLHDFHYFARDVIGSFFLNQGYLFIGVIIICIIGILFYTIIKKVRNEQIEIRLQFILMVSSITITLLPVILLIQSVYPFNRVFAFIGIEMTLLFIGEIQILISLLKIIKNRLPVILRYLLVVTLSLYTLTKCFNSYYNAPYYKQDQYVREVMEAIEDTETVKKTDKESMMDIKSIFSTDTCCDYQIYFYYIAKGGKGINLIEDRETPDVLILNKRILNSSGDWTNHTTMEELPQEWMSKNMRLTFENDMYQLYKKK